MTDEVFPILGSTIAPMIGRGAVVDEVFGELTKQSPSHLSIVGPRFSGKTVLLHAIKAMMDGDSTYGYVELWDLGHLTPLSDGAFIDQLCERLGYTLRDRNAEISNELKDLKDGDFGNLKEIVELINEDGIKILMLWDGFDRPLKSGRLTRNLWDQLRELASIGAIRLVTATRKPMLELIRSEESATSDFWNIFRMNPVRIGRFADEDHETILGHLASLNFEPGAITELNGWSNWYPPLALSILNKVSVSKGEGAITNEDIAVAAKSLQEQLIPVLDRLWSDCPIAAQDHYRALCKTGDIAKSSIDPQQLGQLNNSGLTSIKGQKVSFECRFMRNYVAASENTDNSMARLFGDERAYFDNIRGLLERRLRHIEKIDSKLKHLVELAIAEIPDHPDTCLNNLSHIEDSVLNLIWKEEFGDELKLPEGLWMEWRYMDNGNKNVHRLEDYKDRKIPDDRFLQLGMLQLITGSALRIEKRARFATKDMYVLIDAIHSFRNRSQHAEGDEMNCGVAVSAIMMCLELLACLERSNDRK